MKNTVLICLLSTTLFSSCKDKKEECVTSVASVAGTYKLTSLRAKPAGGTESEIIASLPDCFRDNLYVLNANTVYIFQDAGIPCTPNGTNTGNWSLSGTTFSLEGEVFVLQSFDCSRLIAYKQDYPSAGDRWTYTFTRQ
ncbi:MAG: lipocalin family protein [Chitinophagaceae bacterium]